MNNGQSLPQALAVIVSSTPSPVPAINHCTRHLNLHPTHSIPVEITGNFFHSEPNRQPSVSSFIQSATLSSLKHFILQRHAYQLGSFVSWLQFLASLKSLVIRNLHQKSLSHSSAHRGRLLQTYSTVALCLSGGLHIYQTAPSAFSQLPHSLGALRAIFSFYVCLLPPTHTPPVQ